MTITTDMSGARAATPGTTSLNLPDMDDLASVKEITFRRLLYSAERQLAGCAADANPDRFTPATVKLKHVSE